MYEEYELKDEIGSYTLYAVLCLVWNIGCVTYYEPVSMMPDGYHTISIRFTHDYKLFVYISELEHIKLPGVYSFVLNSIYGFP